MAYCCLKRLLKWGGVLESPVKSDVGDFSVLHVRVQQVERAEVQPLAKNVLLDRITISIGIEQPVQVAGRHAARFCDHGR